MGIITAEATYPHAYATYPGGDVPHPGGTAAVPEGYAPLPDGYQPRSFGGYSTYLNEISDLGVAPFPGSRGDQPSVLIFNGAMMVAGASIAGAAYLLARAVEARSLAFVLGLHALGTFGVGLFPSDQRAIHLGAAVLTFATGGVAALLASRVQAGAGRHASALLGAAILTSLVLTGLGPVTPVHAAIGPGGIERWIAYPTVLWLASFGGYLTGTPRIEDRARED